MIILTLRTDRPEAEIGLYHSETQLAYDVWQAHRQLAETLHRRIEALLSVQSQTWDDIEGIVCFQGPGSFTGLRIGLSVANALAESFCVPIVATQEPAWLETGVARLLGGESDGQAMPFYGADAHITLQKK